MSTISDVLRKLQNGFLLFSQHVKLFFCIPWEDLDEQLHDCPRLLFVWMFLNRYHTCKELLRYVFFRESAMSIIINNIYHVNLDWLIIFFFMKKYELSDFYLTGINLILSRSITSKVYCGQTLIKSLGTNRWTFLLVLKHKNP